MSKKENYTNSASKISDSELLDHYRWLLEEGRIQQGGSAFMRMQQIERGIAKKRYARVLKRANIYNGNELL